MTTAKQFDALNRLQSISSSPSSSSSISFTYSYNDANQRTVARLNDGNYWRFGYDSLGQVTVGHKYFADQTPVAGQQFDYAFDTIGNRTQTKAGGDSTGANQRVANYFANLLNQYTNRDVPGAVDIIGVSIATNAVTVNGHTAYRKGEYFRQQLNVNNTSAAVWTNITVSATGQSSQSGNQFVPKTQEQFAYDLDGNLMRDGRWNYGWDAENRLVALTNNNPTVGPQQVLRFEYDARGRRIHKQVWGNNIGSGSPTSDLKLLYDGWNLVAILSSPSSLLESFLWGLDLSGSLQGAGGVGGLLEVAYYGAATTNCFAAFDGNGNVAALVNAADGTSVAQYEYGPFGEVIRATGPMAKANPFRWSTQYTDDETDLVCYLHRYYSPSTGRWLSRDPLGDEAFFANYVAGKSPKEEQWFRERSLDPAYVFCQNAPVIYYDADGCIAPVLIFSVGNAINNGILACYYCSKLKKCLGTAHDYSQRASQGMEPDAYLAWLAAAKPGSECAELAKGCGVSVIKLTCWVGARFLVLRYNVLNPTVN